MRLTLIQFHRLRVGPSEKKATATTLRILKRDLPLRASAFISPRGSLGGETQRD